MSIDRLQSHFRQPVISNSATKEKEAKETGKPESSLPKAEIQSLNRLHIGAQMLSVALGKSVNTSFKGTSAVSKPETDSVNLANPAESITPFEFDFEEVAKNVMGFVSEYVGAAKAGGASDSELKELMAQARAGIDSGFEMARDELSGIGILDPELEEGIDKSYDLLQDGMKELDDQLFGAPAVGPQGLATIGASTSYYESESTSLSLTTVEGDEVELVFSSSASAAMQHSAEGKSSQFNQSQSFSFEVKGDISEEEYKAISALVNDVSKLADNFFNGDVEKAWQQAQELGFDDSQIAGFAMELKEVKQVQITRHYAGVAELGDKGGKPANPLAEASGYLKDLQSIAKESEELLSGDGLQSLMDKVVETGFDLNEQMLKQQQQAFADFNKRLLNAVNDQ